MMDLDLWLSVALQALGYLLRLFSDCYLDQSLLICALQSVGLEGVSLDFNAQQQPAQVSCGLADNCTAEQELNRLFSSRALEVLKHSLHNNKQPLHLTRLVGVILEILLCWSLVTFKFTFVLIVQIC